MTTTVTTKGQIVIPSEIRRKYGIKVGTKIQFQEEDDGIKIYPITENVIDENIGILGTKGKLIKRLLEEKQIEKEL